MHHFFIKKFAAATGNFNIRLLFVLSRFIMAMQNF